MDMIDDLKIIDDELIKNLNQIGLNKIEYWDIKASIGFGTNLDFTDQKSKEISSFIINECGIRSFINGGWGFVVLKDISKNSIKDGFLKAIKLAKLSESLTKKKFQLIELDPLVKDFKITNKKELDDISIEEKIELAKYHEKVAADYSPEIKNTRTYYFDGHSNSLFLNSFGSHIYQDLTLIRLFNMSFAQKNGIIQRAVNSIGGLGGFEIVNTEEAKNLSSKTAKEVIELLDAKSPIGENLPLSWIQN